MLIFFKMETENKNNVKFSKKRKISKILESSDDENPEGKLWSYFLKLFIFSENFVLSTGDFFRQKKSEEKKKK